MNTLTLNFFNKLTAIPFEQMKNFTMVFSKIILFIISIINLDMKNISNLRLFDLLIHTNLR